MAHFFALLLNAAFEALVAFLPFFATFIGLLDFFFMALFLAFFFMAFAPFLCNSFAVLLRNSLAVFLRAVCVLPALTWHRITVLALTSDEALDFWHAGVLERPRTWAAGDCEGGRPRRAGVADG